MIGIINLDSLSICYNKLTNQCLSKSHEKWQSYSFEAHGGTDGGGGGKGLGRGEGRGNISTLM